MITEQELNRREILNEQGHWDIPDNIDTSNFNFDWRPFKWDRPQTYQFGTQHQRTGGPRYIVPDSEGTVFISEQHAIALPSTDNWVGLVEDADIQFDVSWHPDAYEPPFIWVFGDGERTAQEFPVIEYHAPGGTEKKYNNELVATVIPFNIRSTAWKILIPIDEESFNFDWKPIEHEYPYIHVFGNQWYESTVEPTVEYRVPGATERKYYNEPIAQVLPDMSDWKIIIPGATIDFSWHPNPYDLPYIHVFGNQWNNSESEPTIEYHVPGATERKYHNDRIAIVHDDMTNWNIIIPESTMNFSWRPNPHEPPMIWVFGNKWNDANTEPTIEYVVPGATERKFITTEIANTPVDVNRWTVYDDNDYYSFDFTFRPNPYSPTQIYQWENNGPLYTPDDATEDTPVVLMDRDERTDVTIKKYYIATTIENLINEHLDEVFWALTPELNYESFDFSWKPSPENFQHVNVFGSEFNSDLQTYYINGPAYKLGHRDLNYIEDYIIDVPPAESDMFYINRGNNDDGRFEQLKQRFPNIQKTRYLNSWMTTILRCVRKAQTKYIWVLSSEVDYTDFDFNFYPTRWQENMIHVFGTQWSHWGNTYMINSETFADSTEHIEQIEHARNINHIRKKRTRLVLNTFDVLYIDHGNATTTLANLREKFGDTVTVLEYDTSYLQTLKTWTNNLSEWDRKSEHYAWVCSSVCDYSQFDFTWVSDPFQRDQLHVVASSSGVTKQLFGDTFFLNINSFRDSSVDCFELREYANKINYINYLHAERLQCPVITHDYDSQADAIADLAWKNTDWPYAEFVNEASVIGRTPVVPSLWDEDESTVIVSSQGASRITVPSIAVPYIHKEVYDYHHIDRLHADDLSRPLDILFISNGESIAEENYEHLVELAERKKLPNRIARVQDVNGRVASQLAAADMTMTSWYFFVNGKLRISEDFDFGWQPDRLQQPKHYIFTATNPVNHLVYGHQAIVANNRQVTRETVPTGLDFTMSSLHATVDMNSGVALYNTDPWTTWRTAFREAIKLKYYGTILHDKAAHTRLDAWLRIGNGDNGQWSTGGAYDAIEYYESVGGDMTELMRSYDWAWLEELYKKKYS